jgi:hypothetical protein
MWVMECPSMFPLLRAKSKGALKPRAAAAAAAAAALPSATALSSAAAAAAAVGNDNSSTDALPTEEAKEGVREGDHRTILYASMLGEPFMQVGKTSAKEFV